MIYAEKLTFGFDERNLLDEVSFTLEKDRHCALIGSNGAGKTTLTNLIRSPEEYAYTGTLRLDGVGRMGYVSQFEKAEKERDVTVFEFLAEDFVTLQKEMATLLLPAPYCHPLASSSSIDQTHTPYSIGANRYLSCLFFLHGIVCACGSLFAE